MAEINDTKQIILGADGSATFERRRERIQEGETPVSRLMETLRVRASELIPERGGIVLLPPRCRLHFSSGDRQVFVVEDEPSIRTVSWETVRCDGQGYVKMHQRLSEGGIHTLWDESKADFRRRLEHQKTFSLSFPYLVRCYLFNVEKLETVTMWYGTKPLTSERSDLLIPNLPNLDFPNATLCCSAYARQLTACNSVAEAIDVFEAEFWGSPWNNHWAEGFFKYADREPTIASPWEWERTTRIDPTFPLRMKWLSQGRTIGQEVRRLLNTASTQRPEEAFAFFEKRLRAADPWDASAPKPQAAEVTPADARSLLLRDGTVIQVGDKISIPERVRLSGMSRNESFEIEWFTRVDPVDQGRRVKLKGYDALVRIIQSNQLLDEVYVVHAAEMTETVRLGEISLMKGCLCRLDLKEYPSYAGAYWLVHSVRTIGRGAVTVQFRDRSEFVVLAEDGVLFPGVELIPPQETNQDGSLKSASITLPDGTVLKVGDKVMYAENTDGAYRYEDVVRKVFPPKIGSAYIPISLMEGSNIACWHNGQRTIRLVSEYTEETEATVGGNPTAVGTVLIYQDYDRTLRTVDALRRDPAGDLYAHFTQKPGSSWYRIANKDVLEKSYTFPPSLVVTRTSFTLGELVYSCENVYQDNQTGDFMQFTSFEEGPYPGMVLGKVGEVTHRILERFQFPKPLERIDFFLKVNDELMLMRGMRIRMARTTYEHPHGKRFIISHFINDDRAKKYALVTTTGHVIPIGQGLFEVRYADVWRSLPVTVAKSEDSIRWMKFVMVSSARMQRFTQRRFSNRVGAPLKLNDAYDVQIRMGDYVLVIDERKVSSNSSERLRQFLMGNPRRVVHAHAYDGWLYLDTEGQNTHMAGMSDEEFARHSGYGTLPPHLQTDKAWRSRIAFVRASGVKVVKPE